LPGERVVFADGGHGVGHAERPLAGDHDVSVGSKLQVKWTQFGVGHQARHEQRSATVEHDDGVVALSGRRETRGQVEPAAGPEAEAARKGDDTLRQQEFSLSVEVSRHHTYRSVAPRGEVVTAIGPELGAARIQAGYPAGVTHDVPVEIQRQHMVFAAVEVHQRT
jgi:hypothetical protein